MNKFIFFISVITFSAVCCPTFETKEMFLELITESAKKFEGQSNCFDSFYATVKQNLSTVLREELERLNPSLFAPSIRCPSLFQQRLRSIFSKIASGNKENIFEDFIKSV